MLRSLAALALGLTAVTPAASIEDVIAAEMPASGVPGMAYAVVADGTTTAAGARGVAEVGDDTPVTTDTPFLTGSISKSFTALAVMQLVEAEEVVLDAELARYLDEFAGRPAGSITISQLLSHTSGFSTLQGNQSHADDTGDEDELAHLVAAVADLEPAYSPGEKWEYSNTNYQILGRLIEVVTAESFAAYVTANILEPVGMENSFVSDGAIHDEMATGHRPWFGTKQPLPDTTTHRATAPQGGVVASAGDLALYMSMMMNGEDDVLSAAGKARMMRPASDASPWYGFGWFIDAANGTVWHSGSTPGFETLATMIPARGEGAVVLVNGGSGIGFGETAQLRNGITAEALGLAYDGEGSRWLQQALFIGLVLLPIAYALSMVWAWTHRAGLRTKSGAFGAFSLWFPVLTTAVAAWAILVLVPEALGAPLSTLMVFQPDFGLVMIAAAVMGVLWALFRVVVAYTGRGAEEDQRPTHPATMPASSSPTTSAGRLRPETSKE